MRNQLQGPGRLAGFVALQLLGLCLAMTLPRFLPGSYALLPDLLLFVAGIAMGVVGLVRCAREGQGPLRLLGMSALVFLGSVLLWPLVESAVLAALRWLLDLDHARSWGVGILGVCLYFFSTGSFAYFRLGPFRSRVSPSQVVRQLIVGNRDLRIGGPARPEVVAKAERLLGLSLPTPFRDFLLDYGDIRGTAVTFLGLGPTTDLDHPSKEDFVGATLDARERLALPRGYALCSVDADGLLACLDTTAIETEIPVVLWDPTTRSVVRVVARSFAEYLVHTLTPKARKW